MPSCYESPRMFGDAAMEGWGIDGGKKYTFKKKVYFCQGLFQWKSYNVITLNVKIIKILNKYLLVKFIQNSWIVACHLVSICRYQGFEIPHSIKSQS